MDIFRPEIFFDLTNFYHSKLFEGLENVWEALGEHLKEYIEENLVVGIQGTVSPDAYIDDTEKVFIGKGTVVEPGAYIKGPAIIGENTEVRQGAYFRGNVIVGNGCVVGHTTEIKGSVMLDGAKAGHFAYIGDSIIGRNVNLGAGTKLANLKVFESTVKVKFQDNVIDTGLRKFGAIIGDGCEIGCNSVTSPGTILGKNCAVYPCLNIGGYFKENSIIKFKPTIEVVKRKD